MLDCRLSQQIIETCACDVRFGARTIVITKVTATHHVISGVDLIVVSWVA